MPNLRPRRLLNATRAFIVTVLLLPLLMVDLGNATAQEQPEGDVILRAALEDNGDGTGTFVIETQPITTLAGAVELVIEYGPGIEVDLTPAMVPACELGSPWAGSCGPQSPTGRMIIAAFTVFGDRPFVSEVIARVPVMLSGDADDQGWLFSVQGIWNNQAHELDAVVVIDVGAAAFLNIAPDCEREVLVVSSDLPVLGASVIDLNEVALEVPLVEVEPGIYEGPPPIWNFEFVAVEVDAAGGPLERRQFFNGVACDADVDTIPDPVDNCPDSYNPSQADFDGNGIGDSCDGALVNCGNGLFRVGTSHASTIESLVGASDASVCWSVGGGGPNFEMTLALFGLDPGAGVDFSPLSAMTVLEIVDSDLTELPNGLTSLDGLRSLSLPGSALQSVPADLANLSNLRTLALADNELADLPEEVWSMATLRRLVLSGNQLESLPSVIGDGLIILDATDNQLTGDATAFLDAWFAVDRDFEDAQLAIDDGPGGNDCVTTSNPSASAVWGLRRIAFECDAQVAVEGQVRAPDGITGVFGAQVCAERPLLETLCVFTDVFGHYRFDDVGQGNVKFSVTDAARRYEAPPTGFIGLVLGDEPATVDFDMFFVGLGGIDPEPEPEPTPGPEPTPAPQPTPEPTPMPEPEAPSDAAMVNTVSGRVVTALGAPAPGVEVCAEMVLVGVGSCTTTGGTGHFFFGGLFSGNYVVSVLVDGQIVDSFRYASVSETQGVAGIELRLAG